MKSYMFDHRGIPYCVTAKTEEEARSELSEHIIRRFGISAAQFPILTIAVYQA